MHGKHLLKTYSRTQSTIALSSAEAELYATVQGASEGLGMAAMALDFGKVMVPWMYVDASDIAWCVVLCSVLLAALMLGMWCLDRYHWLLRQRRPTLSLYG